MSIETKKIIEILIFVGLAVLASGLGSLPFALLSKIKNKDKIIYWSSVFAAGLMLGVSAILIYEGMQLSFWKTIVGLALGLLFINLTSWIVKGWWKMEWAKKLFFSHMPHKDFAKAILIIGGMSFHAIAEWIWLGVWFAKGEQLGILLALAMMFHNIPEWMAVAGILVPRKVPWLIAWWWAVFTSMPQLIFAILAYIFVTIFEGLLPVGLGFAAWSMVRLGTSEVFLEAQKIRPGRKTILITAILAILTICVELFI